MSTAFSIQLESHKLCRGKFSKFERKNRQSPPDPAWLDMKTPYINRFVIICSAAKTRNKKNGMI